MDNEKLTNEELETTETTEEVVEEAVAEEVVEETEVAEETGEVAEEVSEDDAEEEAEEVSEEAEVTIVQIWQCPDCETICDESVCNVCGAECELVEIEATAGEITEGPRKNLGAIIGAAVAAVVVILAALWYFGVINPYEIGYVDVTGTTLKDVADQSGLSIKEYKKINGLSWFMSKYTNENAVTNNVKVKTVIANSGMKFEEFKDHYGWNDSITENSTVGEALGETKLEVILGVKDVEKEIATQTINSFKEFYGFGEEVTLDTLYKDVRVAIDKKTKEARIEQEKAAKEAENATPEAEADADAEAEAEADADAEAETDAKDEAETSKESAE